jgi:hypothetical protein
MDTETHEGVTKWKMYGSYWRIVIRDQTPPAFDGLPFVYYLYRDGRLTCGGAAKTPEEAESYARVLMHLIGRKHGV